MKYAIDPEYTKTCFRELVNVPSPVGYYEKMNPVIERIAADLGHGVSYDNKSTAYLTLEGQDNTKTVEVMAHLDTIGLIIRGIDPDGKIRVRKLGGINYSTLDGESVQILTRKGKTYTGLLLCEYHSVHVWQDVARGTVRTEDNMMLLLDEPVSSREDVAKLGIRSGDLVDVEPRCRITDNGFLKSRYVDDKACVSSVLTAVKYLKDNCLKPRFRTLLAFPYGEEVAIGGPYVPPEVSELIAMDIGLIGPGLEGSEHKVSICAKDAAIPYDYELTNRLIRFAESNGIPHAVDVYFNYSTDARAALIAGANVRTAVFGPGTYGTHGMERTHMDGVNATTELLLSWLLEQ